MVLSEIQKKFLAKARQGVHLASGSVRSGKTFVGLYAFLGFLVSPDAKPGISCLLTAKKRDCIERNLFQPLREILEQEVELKKMFDFRTQPYRVKFLPKGIECYCEGANDEKAEEKVRGITLQAWVGDEVSLYPRGFFVECLARLSAGARLALLTCNPSSLTHYIFTEFIAPKKIHVYNFKLTDNHTLDKDYMEMLRSNYTGVQYVRFIDGEWGGAEEDMVLPEYQAMREEILVPYEMPQDFHPVTALDVGWKDFTFAVLGHHDHASDTLVVDNELCIKKNMTTDILAKRLIDVELDTWGREAKQRWTDVDLRLIEDMNRLHGIIMLPTRKDNKDAQVNALRVRTRNGKLKIHPRCQELDKQLLGATWEKNRRSERSYARTEDCGHFDGVDALLYLMRNLITSNPAKDPILAWRKQGLFVSPNYKRGDTPWKAMIPPLKIKNNHHSLPKRRALGGV